MRIESSSATLPPSSFCTISSSSASAFSNGSVAMSVFASLLSFAISSLHQFGDMRGGGFGETFEIVAAFQHRDDAAAGMSVGDIHQLLRHPGVIGLDQIDVGQRVAGVGVEARRDDQ